MQAKFLTYPVKECLGEPVDLRKLSNATKQLLRGPSRATTTCSIGIATSTRSSLPWAGVLHRTRTPASKLGKRWTIYYPRAASDYKVCRAISVTGCKPFRDQGDLLQPLHLPPKDTFRSLWCRNSAHLDSDTPCLPCSPKPCQVRRPAPACGQQKMRQLAAVRTFAPELHSSPWTAALLAMQESMAELVQAPQRLRRTMLEHPYGRCMRQTSWQLWCMFHPCTGRWIPLGLAPERPMNAWQLEELSPTTS